MFVLRLYRRLFANVLILLNILNQTVSQAISLQRGQQSSACFIDHVNYVLNVEKIESKQVIGMAHCLQECIRNHGCFSTNIAVDRSKNGRFTCDLLPTDKYSASTSIKRRKFFHHFSLVSPCEGAPCKHGGTCRAIYETNEYKCDCLSDSVDKNCEPKAPIPLNATPLISRAVSTTPLESASVTQVKSVSPSPSSQIQPMPTAIPSTAATPCDPSDGWIHFSGSCYKFFASPASKQTAKTQCESVGAHLITGHSDSEQDFITLTVIPSSEIIWDGLERDLNSGTFTNWDDGSPLDFTDWGRQRPTSQESGEHCVALRPSNKDPSDYVWNDIFCTFTRAFVCEKGA